MSHQTNMSAIGASITPASAQRATNGEVGVQLWRMVMQGRDAPLLPVAAHAQEIVAASHRANAKSASRSSARRVEEPQVSMTSTPAPMWLATER
jgi:hypothetical protein